MKARFVEFLLTLCLAGAAFGATPEIYISPGTGTAYSGVTLVDAVEHALQLRAAPGETVKIFLREGRYLLQSPLVLVDSGLEIAAAPGAHPIISGGMRIDGWKPSKETPGVWETRILLGGAGDDAGAFRELFVDGLEML